MQRGTWIILSNSGGEIDRFFVAERDGEDDSYDLSVALVRLTRVGGDWSILSAGDTIAFVEGESEC